MTRTLYRERKVLHRDIGSGNVLVRPHGMSGGHNKYNFLAVEHVLDPSTHHAMDSNILLIDFDRSQICDDRGGQLNARTVSSGPWKHSSRLNCSTISSLQWLREPLCL